MEKFEMALMTSGEVREAIAKGRDVVVWPIGATEQHGPYLALGTDFLGAQAVARRTAELAGGLLAPTLPFGMSANHVSFPGAMVLTPTTFTHVIRDICLGFLRDGFRLVLVVNGHGGNGPCIDSGLWEAKIAAPRQALLMYVSYWEALKDDYHELAGVPKGSMSFRTFWAHAGIMEASMVRATDERGFDPAKAAPADMGKAQLADDSFIKTVVNIETKSPTGAFGDPTRADAEMGKKIIERAAQLVARELARVSEVFG